MKISIWTDHHGYNLWQEIIKILNKKNIAYMYAWARNSEDISSDDKVVEYITMDVLDENILWIIITDTGIWANIQANKVEWINATLCNNFNQVRWAREEHNVNIICLSAFEEEYLDIEHIVNTFLNCEYKK
jgi:RpiB/LacA/LacB family sugar-phosphate isomerase